MYETISLLISLVAIKAAEINENIKLDLIGPIVRPKTTTNKAIT
jgi:hypothetical protein